MGTTTIGTPITAPTTDGAPTVSTAPHQPVRPPERYGDDTPAWHRTAARIGAIVLVVLGVAWVIWSGLWQGDRPSGTVVTWSTVDNGHMKVALDVTMEPGHSGRCTLVARDNRQDTVGQTDLAVPSSHDRTRRIDTVVNTQGRGASVTLESCTDR